MKLLFPLGSSPPPAHTPLKGRSPAGGAPLLTVPCLLHQGGPPSFSALVQQLASRGTAYEAANAITGISMGLWATQPDDLYRLDNRYRRLYISCRPSPLCPLRRAEIESTVDIRKAHVQLPRRA